MSFESIMADWYDEVVVWRSLSEEQLVRVMVPTATTQMMKSIFMYPSFMQRVCH